MVQKIRRAIVALDHSDLDKELVKYASFLANTTEVEHLYFVHVVNLHLPSKVLAEFPNLEKEALAERKVQIDSLVAILYIQVKSLASPRNLPIPFHTLIKTSCTRSSASS